MAQNHPTASTSSASHNGAPSVSSSNGNASLFNNDEMRFMDDSFSNADSFDPFTAGMPGFKVPAVLPPNLGGMGAAPRPGSGDGGAAGNDTGKGGSRWLNRGYGQDKAWQLQQLEALQAERNRYMANARPSEQTNAQSLPDFTHSGPIAHSLHGMGGSHPHPTLHQDPHAMSQYNPGEPSASAGNDLSRLALQFPSSHQFPAARDDCSSAANKKQRTFKNEEYEGRGSDEQKRGRSPSARPPWTLPPNMNSLQTGSSNGGGAVDAGGAGPSQRDMLRDPTLSAQGRASLSVDMDAPYTYLPAPKPPAKLIDWTKAEAKSKSIPPQLKDAFFSPNLARYQPHLAILRQEQMRRKEQGLSANIRKGDKKANNSNKQREDSQDDGDGEKKKAGGHTLLTEAEKKANHIASEQKRRANIRKGYEMLCDLVPSLREGADDGEEQGGMGMEDGSGNEEDDDEVKRGKRRRGPDGNSGGAIVGGGDKFDGRGGPRSEAVILMAAVEHLRRQLEIHQDLVSRKQDAQLRVAHENGLDIRKEE